MVLCKHKSFALGAVAEYAETNLARGPNVLPLSPSDQAW